MYMDKNAYIYTYIKGSTLYSNPLLKLRQAAGQAGLAGLAVRAAGRRGL